MSKTYYGDVYILHFEQKISHALHYVGFSKDPHTRLEQHRATVWTPLEQPCQLDEKHVKRGVVSGDGAVILAYLNHLGIAYTITRIFPHVTYAFERALKNTNNTARYCPICNPKAPEYHPKGI